MRKGLEELTSHRLHVCLSPEPPGGTFRPGPVGVLLLKPYNSALVLLLHPPPSKIEPEGGCLFFFFKFKKLVWQEPRLKGDTEVLHIDTRSLQFR